VTELPDTWDEAPDYTKINRNQVQWNFRLVFSLANNLRYQDAMQDIQHMFGPAETAFFNIQKDVEKTAARVLRKEGLRGLERFLNAYSGHCLKQVGYAYKELVDYLMFRYLVDHSEVAPPELPVNAIQRDFTLKVSTQEAIQDCPPSSHISFSSSVIKCFSL